MSHGFPYRFACIALGNLCLPWNSILEASLLNLLHDLLVHLVEPVAHGECELSAAGKVQIESCRSKLTANIPRSEQLVDERVVTLGV